MTHVTWVAVVAACGDVDDVNVKELPFIITNLFPAWSGQVTCDIKVTLLIPCIRPTRWLIGGI